MIKTRFTLTLYLDDMGSFQQRGCTDFADALWHVNNARDHDGLRHLSMPQLKALLRGTEYGKARVDPQ